MSHVYSRLNLQKASQYCKVIVEHIDKLVAELDRTEGMPSDRLVCDKTDCKHRQYKDHDGNNT